MAERTAFVFAGGGRLGAVRVGMLQVLALHAITLLIAWPLLHELEAMPPGIRVHRAPALCPLAVSPYDFSASRQLIERAIDSTRAWVDGGGLTRPAQARELAAHHHHHWDGSRLDAVRRVARQHAVAAAGRRRQRIALRGPARQRAGAAEPRPTGASRQRDVRPERAPLDRQTQTNQCSGQ